MTILPLMVEEEDLHPEDDSGFRILGTQVMIHVAALRDQETFKRLTDPTVLTYDLKNPSEADIRNSKSFTCHNEFTYSNLHEVHDGRIGVIAQTWLKAELVQNSNQKILKDAEWLRLLNNANKVVLNMKLQNLPDFINSYAFMKKRELEQKNVLMRDLFSSNLYKAFSAMQVYKGHSIAEITSNQKELESYVKIIRS